MGANYKPDQPNPNDNKKQSQQVIIAMGVVDNWNNASGSSIYAT